MVDAGSGGRGLPLRAPPDRATGFRGYLPLAFVLGVGAVFIVALWVQLHGVNGPWYWSWPWRRLKPLRSAIWLGLPMIPFALVVWRIESGVLSRRAVGWLLGALMLVCFALQVCAMLSHPPGLPYLQAIVESVRATSYYSEAQRISDLSAWLATFHTAQLGLHASTHPPGPIVYYYFWLELAGPGAAAVFGGLALGALATLGIPLMYRFVGLWIADRAARLTACAYYALVPAIVLFLPEFDQVYPVLTMITIVVWVTSLRSSPPLATIAGLSLAVATFFAFNLLAIGAFLALYAICHILSSKLTALPWGRVLSSGAFAAAGFMAFYAVLWLATGYNPLLTFVHALSTQQALMLTMDRPWSASVLFDPYDFLLGSGILAAPLLALFIARAVCEFDWSRADLVLPLIGLATIAIVDISGLLPTETARVWMFMQPFAIAPAAGELMRFRPQGRLLFFAMQWLTLLAMFCRITFVQP